MKHRPIAAVASPWFAANGVWQLANGPTFGQRVTVTKSDMIKF